MLEVLEVLEAASKWPQAGPGVRLGWALRGATGFDELGDLNLCGERMQCNTN